MRSAFALVSFLLISFFSSCDVTEKRSQTIKLHHDWEFTQANDTNWRSAKVPGCVHTDLMQNGIIEHPYFFYNEDSARWIDKEDWIYQTKFDLPITMKGLNKYQLQFDGLDTYADIYLNGKKIDSTKNAHCTYIYDVSDVIEPSGNELKIYFHNTLDIAGALRDAHPYLLPNTNEQLPFDQRQAHFVRKPSYQMGWDWGPRLVTAGIWRDVSLKAWKGEKIDDAYYRLKSLSNEKAVYNVDVEIDAAENKEVELGVGIDISSNVASSKIVKLNKGINKFSIQFEIKNPKLWWTVGLGDQHLYDLFVYVKEREELVDQRKDQIGVRKLELVQEKDSTGSGVSFYFKLNDVPVFMKGTNYIPSEVFPSAVTDSIYLRDIKTALDANMNMIRVWGGAIYESDYFYELCNRAGILVWQDFMYACNLYPHDKQFLANAEKEAIDNVKRLRNHPSLALWCGNNEILQGFHRWGWKSRYKHSDEDSTEMLKGYKMLFEEMLPNVVSKYDQDRKYWPSSPASNNGLSLSNLVDGDDHMWRVWFSKAPFDAYEKEISRFVSEYGLQSFPELETFKLFMDEDSIYDGSHSMKYRQRSPMPWRGKDYTSTEMIKHYSKKYYGYKEGVGIDTLIYISQLMQAKGLRQAIETHRVNMPYCMGSLYWQINDCWPGITWSTMDYFGNLKASHYAVKLANEPVHVYIKKEGYNKSIYTISDLLEDKKMKLVWNYIIDDKVVATDTSEVTVEGNKSQNQQTISTWKLSKFGSKSKGLIEALLYDGNTLISESILLNKDEKEFDFQNPNIQIKTEKMDSIHYKINLTSSSFAHGVRIKSNMKGNFDYNYIDISPTRSKSILFTAQTANANPKFTLESFYNYKGK